ncbi:MAG: hypothetical protein AB8F94_15325 [Saprospiraceae bacterium]
MNLKTLNLFTLLFFLNISAILSQSPHKENFRITIAGNYFQSGRVLGSCLAVQVSNQEGEFYYHHKINKSDQGKDLVIEFAKKPSSKVLVTCFVIGISGGKDAYTYVDVENGSYIDSHRFSYTWSDPYRTEHKGKTLKIELDDIKNLKNFHIPSPSYRRQLKYSVEDGTLTSKYYHTNEVGIYFLLKSNGRTYQYFFDENDGVDSKNREIKISESFEDLYSCRTEQRIHFPKVGIWKGTLKVWFKDFEKPTYVFSNTNVSRVRRQSYWELHLPEYEIEYSHIEINPRYSSFAINKIYEGLPEEIIPPNITITAPQETSLKSNLKFNTSKNVGFYIATYGFNIGGYHSEQRDHYITNVSRWEFIGIDQFIDIKFPKIHINLISEVEGLAELQNPEYLSIMGYQVDYENPEDVWTTPHTLLRRSWQMESGIFGVRKTFKFK